MHSQKRLFHRTDFMETSPILQIYLSFLLTVFFLVFATVALYFDVVCY